MSGKPKKLVVCCQGGDKCPAIYRSESGDYIAQGYVIRDRSSLGIEVGPEEDLLRLPKALIDELHALLDKGHS